MPLTQAHVDELKALYRMHLGKDLPDDKAWAMAYRLIGLFKLLQQRENQRRE